MGEKQLREKYGGKLAKAINRAIRAEIPSGNAALDKLMHLSAPILQAGWKDRQGNPTPEAAAYYKHKHDVVDKMEAQIREKWSVGAVPKRPVKARKRSGGGDAQADRTPAKAYRRGAAKGKSPLKGKK